MVPVKVPAFSVTLTAAVGLIVEAMMPPPSKVSDVAAVLSVPVRVQPDVGYRVSTFTPPLIVPVNEPVPDNAMVLGPADRVIVLLTLAPVIIRPDAALAAILI